EMLGGHARAPEDEFVAVMAPVQHLAGDRVVEGLGAFGLLVVVEQAEVRELDRRPELLALGLRKALAHRLDGFLDALVVHQDARAREPRDFAPRGALVQAPGVDRRLAKEPVVPVETGEDGARDLLRQAGPPLVDPKDLGDRAHLMPLLVLLFSSHRRIARLRSSRAARW